MFTIPDYLIVPGTARQAPSPGLAARDAGDIEGQDHLLADLDVEDTEVVVRGRYRSAQRS
ncbi:hypothetical protein [Streptomyces sp. NPDC056785]|uniref:hypothetical protein n=1 Tax=Streptomyces sp. NPDC056785 TaxID=3345944 RepID=UPI0036B94800